jgi:hypothetical protein
LACVKGADTGYSTTKVALRDPHRGHFKLGCPERQLWLVVLGHCTNRKSDHRPFEMQKATRFGRPPSLMRENLERAALQKGVDILLGLPLIEFVSRLNL